MRCRYTGDRILLYMYRRCTKCYYYVQDVIITLCCPLNSIKLWSLSKWAAALIVMIFIWLDFHWLTWYCLNCVLIQNNSMALKGAIILMTVNTSSPLCITFCISDCVALFLDFLLLTLLHCAFTLYCWWLIISLLGK